MDISFLEKDTDNKTKGYFTLPASAEDRQLDITMEGIPPYGRMLHIKIYDENKTPVYSNEIRMCRNMGLYITIRRSPDINSEQFYYEFSEKIQVTSMILRDKPSDILDIEKHMTLQSYENKKYTCNFAKSNGLIITWFVTWLCNYQCPYCWERMDENKYRNSANKLNQIEPEKWAEALNRFHPDEIYLTGGEPTIFRKLPEVIRSLNPGILLRMTTNFGSTFDLMAYKEFVLQGRFKSLTASFHPSEVSQEKFLEKIDQALVYGYGRSCNFGIELVMYPSDIEYAQKLMEYCRKNRLYLFLDKYSDPQGKYKESEEEQVKIEALIQESRKLNLNLRGIQGKKSLAIQKEDLFTLSEIVLCGAGARGIRLGNQLLRQKHTGFKCFCDNNSGVQEKKIGGVEVLSFECAVKKYPQAHFIITVKDRAAVSEMTFRLAALGINRENIGVFEDKVPVRKFVREKQPVWCPAGLMSFHVDPEGDIYPCMIAISNKKLFGTETMPLYKVIGNILKDSTLMLPEQPQLCWESFRCSACDYSILEQGMTNVEMENEVISLPLPE